MDARRPAAVCSERMIAQYPFPKMQRLGRGTIASRILSTSAVDRTTGSFEELLARSASISRLILVMD